MCVCVREACLMCPLSSLEGSRSCMETRPGSSLCSCCSVMLLALNTQTHVCERRAAPCWTLRRATLFVFGRGFVFKGYSRKVSGTNRAASAFDVSMAMMHRRAESVFFLSLQRQLPGNCTNHKFTRPFFCRVENQPSSCFPSRTIISN